MSGNTAEFGGGVFAPNESSGYTTIENSSISSNTASAAGGGIPNGGGVTGIQYSTIAKNTAILGSGVLNIGPQQNLRTEVLSTSISGNANNNDVNLAGSVNTFQSSGYNTIGGGNATSASDQPGDKTGVFNSGLKLLANYGCPT